MAAAGVHLLQAVYWKVFTISDYVYVLQTGSEPKLSLLQEGDIGRYKTFLSELLVCIPRKAKKICSPISFLQLSTQREVVARVIQRICEKNKKNVLAFGYGLAAEKSSLRVTFAPSICNYFPNPTTATVSTSVLWETLLSRVGDDVMMHLLENCSLFMRVPPNCYQMCGQPIYNVTKEETLPSPWLKKDCSIYKGNVLSQYIQRRSFTSNTCSRKMTTLRQKIKSQRNVKVKKVHTEVMVEAGDIHSSIGPLKHLENVGTFTTEDRHTKRAPLIENCDIPAKRRKTELKQTDVHTSASVTAEAPSVIPGDHIVWQCASQSESEKHSAVTTGNFRLSDFVEPQDKASYDSLCTPSGRTSPSNVFVDFGKMLCTNPISKEGFLESFLLNMLDSNTRGSLNLIERIFLNTGMFEQDIDLQVPSQGKRKKKVCKRYWQLIPIFQELIENHKRCPYMSLLKKHCPVKLPVKNRTEMIEGKGNEDGLPSSKTQRDHRDTAKTDWKSSNTAVHCTVRRQSNVWEEKENTRLIDKLYALLKQHSSAWQVYTFVRECLHIVVPKGLWGSSHNKCRFFRNVKMLIKSVKYEKISLSELMCKMRVEDCPWLRLKKRNHFVPASEHLLREKILSKFLFWLMDTYVIQLLKAFYYITETSFQKNRLFFYRNCIWGQLQKIGVRKHMTNVKLRLMSTDEIENMKQQKKTPLVSRLRFIPKTNGLRPIVKMCDTLGSQQSKEIKQRKILYFNTQVRNLFSILNYERNKSSNLIGSSVFGLDDIYKKWKTYVLWLKESNSENVKFYFVKTDIKEAYDTIPHPKLEEVISKVIKPDNEEVYCIRRYAVLWMDSCGRIRKSFKRHVSNFVDFIPNMKCFLKHVQEVDLIQNSILVEQNLSLNQNSSKLLAFSQQIIFNHILRLNDQYYMQCCGIPQGSMLSALLCSLCYGDMENKLFCGIQEHGVFMRLIDDFLLVTPHLEQAKRFLRTLAEGLPDYGCSISLDKTVVNFPIDDISECSTVEQLPGHSLLRWCGLLLDTKTLEVFCDYSSFSCTSVRSSLSFCHSSKAGENLRHKLLNVLQLKCHSLFLDLQVNSLRTVYINAYKILLLQAYRFHACVIQLPFGQSIKNNPQFFLTVISDMAPCFYTILKYKNKDFTLGAKDASGPFPFESAQWLTCHAFITKLSIYNILYKTLLVPLHHCKKQLSRSLPYETISLLKEVTDTSLHKDFSTIMD
ncbi:telomerase reverse transcriptase isoform X1 [Bufo bufo]|uniref:telomerase reverse transcriptase isoform X1 n=1 Tax=Bufo bufo TaxID=8384 RepID=UPI001ABDEF88|nr:telomerase reverse transcriptase isoform X1 [Bufo bufo]